MGSLDIFLLGGAVAFKAGSPILSVLEGISEGLYLQQMPFLHLPHSFIYGTFLLLDESFELDLLPVAGDHKGVGLPCHLCVRTFFYHFTEALGVGNTALHKL